MLGKFSLSHLKTLKNRLARGRPILKISAISATVLKWLQRKCHGTSTICSSTIYTSQDLLFYVEYPSSVSRVFLSFEVFVDR